MNKHRIDFDKESYTVSVDWDEFDEPSSTAARFGFDSESEFYEYCKEAERDAIAAERGE